MRVLDLPVLDLPVLDWPARDSRVLGLDWRTRGWPDLDFWERDLDSWEPDLGSSGSDLGKPSWEWSCSRQQGLDSV